MTQETGHLVNTIAFSPDGEALAYDEPENVVFLNCSTRQVSARFMQWGTSQVAFSPRQGTRLASGRIFF